MENQTAPPSFNFEATDKSDGHNLSINTHNCFWDGVVTVEIDGYRVRLDLDQVQQLTTELQLFLEKSSGLDEFAQRREKINAALTTLMDNGAGNAISEGFLNGYRW